MYLFPTVETVKKEHISHKHETPGVKTGNDISEMTSLALFSYQV